MEDFIKEELTNEKLKKRFTSQFDLVNYAIKLAAEMIRSGRAPRVHSDVQNVALLIMQELKAGKDQFDDFDENEEEVVVIELQEIPG
jgi:DNA-directed RNA polymerase subunit omega